MSRFTFELAGPEDGTELLEILEDAPFAGNISLLYTRRPDAYASLMHEGPQVDVIVCRDRERGRIVGFGACALRRLFVNGTPQTVGYLFGLRTRPEYQRKFPLLHKGYALIPDLHRERGVSCYLTTILEDNHYARRLLEKRRAGMPAYLPDGAYTVYTVLQRKRFWPPDFAPWRFCRAGPDDLPRLVTFLLNHGQNWQFFPHLRCEDVLNGVLPGLDAECFYLLCDSAGQIQAAGALWDQAAYKQYVLHGYGGVFRLLAPLSRACPLIGFPALPQPGTRIPFCTLSFWAVANHDPAVFHRFLRGMAYVGREYPFFLVGLHERHPFGRVVERRPHIRYRSRLYLVSWDDERDVADLLDQARPPYIECGLL